MAHFCWYLKLVFLLLMLCRCQTRPASRQSDLIAGNEFLKLFLDHDEQLRSLHSSESEGRADSEVATARASSSRSLEHRTRYRNVKSQHEADDGGKQVVKLVTTGSKIVFLDEAPQGRPAGKSRHSDEVKVVAVSVSSSSKRGGRVQRPKVSASTTPPSAAKTTVADFINRSHKSELSIEEAEPLTMHGKRRLAADVMDSESDSLNSASNIQNVLAAPLVAAASKRTVVAYHGGGRNATESSTPARINQNHADTSVAANAADTHDSDASEDKLLPFQTVIYHDTKQGHGPQSRSISYSSISQNVDDLQTWQQSDGILAEAQRNVSEILRPLARPAHASEPAKFYSVPSKMYSVPSKFYSEPSKVYSEPAKVYGQPEKVYSQPAKVYGQPSKFYSEPAKVYSQPAKVYGEPAKTYWPQSVSTSTTSSTTTTTSTTTRRPPTTAGTAASTTMAPPATVPPGAAPTTFLPSRRPAIVSRIAFGEAHTTATSSSTTTTTTAAAASMATTARPSTWQQHYHSHNQQQQHHQSQSQNSQPRRVLFNLDKLPYDLLNAPQPILSKSPTGASRQQQQHQYHYHQQQQQPQQQQQHNLPKSRPCWEQRQHSSLSVQHSNQNAKGLPNRGLVKCVSKFAHQHATSAAGISAYSYSSSSTSSSYSSSSSVGDPAMPQHFTTERAELFTPTPEQNYEIEESVSVMTNGRAHGVQGGSGGGVGVVGAALATTPATPATTTVTTTLPRSRNRGIDRGRGSVVYNANANANDYDDGGGGGSGSGGENDDSGGGDGGGQSASDEDKVAYVEEGSNYRKYRVEEKTDDGFIVGEYGVVDHNDGNLRGVRYTADSTINRSLIQKALLTFLKLK